MRITINRNIMLILLLTSVILVAGCTTISNVVACKPNWVKNNVFVLNDQAGYENCKAACYNAYQTPHINLVSEGLGATCYCDVNKCGG